MSDIKRSAFVRLRIEFLAMEAALYAAEFGVSMETWLDLCRKSYQHMRDEMVNDSFRIAVRDPDGREEP